MFRRRGWSPPRNNNYLMHPGANIQLRDLGIASTPSVSCTQGEQNPNDNNGQETIDSNPSAKSEAEAVQPVDPNEIVGTDGWLVVDEWGDTVRWVSAKQSLPYTVYFENDPLMATAAAQVVTVRLKLHPLMNIADFRVGTFGFGNHVFPVEGSPLQYQTRLDLVEKMNLFVDVVAGIDITRNEAFWIFSSIDPITGIAPTESDRGFLAVNDSTHVGEGFVTFSIKPIADRCHTGDTIGVQASIVFDVNEAIETNRWVNTIDAVAPTSSMEVLQGSSNSVYVVFSGTDDATGMAAYRLYYTENSSSFRLAGRYLEGDTAVIEVEPDSRYSFFSLGEDMVGNIEPMKGEPDTLFGNTSVRLLASVWPDGAGSITGTGSYTLGDTANIFVQPAEGYRLLRWTEGGVPQGTDALLTMVAEQNHNYTAEMIQMSYPLTVMAAEGTTIAVTTRTAAGEMPAYQSVQHFDTLDIHIEASPCYGNVSFSLNGLPFAADTMLVVHEAVSLSSAATPQVDTGYVYDTVCRNTPYTANGFNILSSATATSGIAYFQLSILNSNGCDSVSRLSLYVKPSHMLSFLANGGEGTMPSQQVCDGEETVLNSSTFTREGFFFAGWATSSDAETAQFVDGGIIAFTTDQILYAVWSSNCVDRESNRMVIACDNYRWNDSTYTTSGEYTRISPDVVPGGCDSIYRLHLTIKYSTENLQQITTCQPYTWIDGQTYNSDTTRQLSMTNTVGCDSLVTLQLVMSSGIYATETVTACDSYEWHGTTYTASTNTPNFTITSVAGCDSTVTLHLTINNSSTGDTAAVACDSLIWHGNSYTTTGTQLATMTNTAGCDSTVTLYLTINNSSTGDTAAVACDSIIWHGNSYTTTGIQLATMTNIAGCDSIVTLHLTINNSSTGDTTAVACDSLIWHGNSYTTTGTHLATMTNTAGCDSTVTLHLTINNSNTGDTTAVACDSLIWHGNSYTTTGTQLATMTNAAGCDSTVTLHLTINNSIETTVTDTAEDSYTWHGNTYTNSGTYQWQGTTNDGCDSTVTLLLVINNVGIEVINGSGISVMVYPNPTTGWITIDADDVLSVEVFDQAGRKVATYEQTNRVYLGGLASGNYMLKIHLQRGQSVQRVILK